MLGNVSFGEILIILAVTLLVFGAKRIPEIARGLGQGIREFQGALREVSREVQAAPPLDVPPAGPRVQPSPIPDPSEGRTASTAQG